MENSVWRDYFDYSELMRQVPDEPGADADPASPSEGGG